MSIEAGTAYITLIPSLRGFAGKAESAIAQSGIGAAVGRATARPSSEAGAKAGGLFSRSFSRAQQSAGGSGIYVAGLLRNLRTYGYALSGVVGLTVGLGLKTASAFQQANVAFTTTLGSAHKAKVLFAQLVQFAKTTPFNLPGVVAASQKLLAFGFTARQVKPMLTSLGDAAAGLSLGTEGLDRLVTAVGQISAKGRLQSDELLQLTEAGVPALRILGNEFGLSTAALQGFVQKGLIPAKKAIPALLSGLETGTTGIAGRTAKFGGLMKKQSKTLGGLFSNLKDALGIGLAKAVKPLLPVLEHALPAATKAIGKAMKSAARDMGEFLHGLGVAKDKSKGTTTGFEHFGSALRTTGRIVGRVFGFIKDNAKTFALVVGAVLSAVAALKVFNIVMAITDAVLNANPISLIVLAIGALAAAFVYAWHKSETFRNIVKGVFHVLELVVGHYAGVVITIFRTILDVWLIVVGNIVHAAATAFGWVPGVGHKLKTAAKYFDGFRSSVDSTLSRLAHDAFNLGASGGANYAAGFNFGVNAAPGGLAGNLNPAVAGGGVSDGPAKAAKKAAQKNTPAFKATGLDFGKSLGDGLKKSAPKVKASTQSLVDSILGPLKALRDQARQLAQSVAQTILGDTGFGAILNQTDLFGQTSFGTSVKSIINGFVAQRLEVLKFRRELRQLESKGLSAGAAAEIAGEGLVAGGQIAGALMDASGKQLRRISRLRSDTHQAANDIGTQVAGDKFGQRIAVEARRTRAAIEKAAHNTDLTPKTVSRLERAYKRAAAASHPYVVVSDVDRREGTKVSAQL